MDSIRVESNVLCVTEVIIDLTKRFKLSLPCLILMILALGHTKY